MRISVVLVAILSLCSCSAGMRFNNEKVSDLEIHRLRNTDYVNLLGDPFRTSNTITGDSKYKHVWYYSAIRDYLVANVSRRSLLLEFKDDDLNAFIYVSSFDEDKTRVDLSKAEKIAIGTTTMNDLLSLLGKPSGKASCPSVLGDFKDKCSNASEVWAWTEIDKIGMLYRSDNRWSKSLFVSFDRAGLVVDMKAIENN